MGTEQREIGMEMEKKRVMDFEKVKAIGVGMAPWREARPQEVSLKPEQETPQHLQFAVQAVMAKVS